MYWYTIIYTQVSYVSDIAVDGQVCFYRRFSQSDQAMEIELQ